MKWDSPKMKRMEDFHLRLDLLQHLNFMLIYRHNYKCLAQPFAWSLGSLSDPPLVSTLLIRFARRYLSIIITTALKVPLFFDFSFIISLNYYFGRHYICLYLVIILAVSLACAFALAPWFVFGESQVVYRPIATAERAHFQTLHS